MRPAKPTHAIHSTSEAISIALAVIRKLLPTISWTQYRSCLIQCLTANEWSTNTTTTIESLIQGNPAVVLLHHDLWTWTFARPGAQPMAQSGAALPFVKAELSLNMDCVERYMDLSYALGLSNIDNLAKINTGQCRLELLGQLEDNKAKEDKEEEDVVTVFAALGITTKSEVDSLMDAFKSLGILSVSEDRPHLDSSNEEGDRFGSSHN